MTTDKLIPDIQQLALSKQMPNGALAAMLSVEQVERLAARYATDGKVIEITALENDILPERYTRNFGTYTTCDQIQLLKSKATVVGLGGLGGTVTEYLARIGVGHLNLVDGDLFEDNNLNRQLLCTRDQLGNPKAQTAAERVCCTNASITVTAYSTFLTSDNAVGFINGSQVVVDCLDAIDSRFMLQTATQYAKIPLVSAAIAGLYGHVTTVLPEDRGLELIYGPPDQHTTTKGAETQLGCLPQAVGLIAAAQSVEAIKVLLGQKTLRNQMLMLDMDSHAYEVLSLM